MQTALRLTLASIVLAAFNLSAATLYVSLESTNPVAPFATWETAATNIQQAVDAAKAADTVLVTDGVYDVGVRDFSVLDTNSQELVSVGLSRVVITNSIRLESVNGPLATTLAGGSTTTTNEDGTVVTIGCRCVYLGTNAVLSGFTVNNGNALSGAGVFCEPSAVVTNCVLTGNSAWSFGGGGAYGGALYDCTLTGNIARESLESVGGGALESTLYNCTLTGNSAGDGGGVCRGTLYNCTLTGNSAQCGGGASRSTLYNCTLTGNIASGGDEFGGGVYLGTLYNCTLTDNSASYGGGALESTLHNCTLTGNSASYGGGAFLSTLYNCVVYYNTAPNGANYSTGICPDWGGDISTLLQYCCTTPLPTNGIGNISGPPLFMDMAAGDFRLREDSPCIDAGTNLVGSVFTDPNTGEPITYAHDATDFLGNTRFIDGNGDGKVAWDIGAYEFIPEVSTQVVDLPDLGLRAAIRVALNKPTGDITVADMESLTELDASRQARGADAPLIHSLEGLQAARNLTQLNLNGEEVDSPNVAISDFSPLAGLTNLTTLHLEGNQLSSLSLPAGLTSLRELHLRGNQLRSLTLPEGLANLRYLGVVENPITYLAVPEAMDLSQLVIEGFPIDQVTIVMVRFGPTSVGSGGSIQLTLSGANGQSVRVQRSTNLVDWEDWRTLTLNGIVKQLLDDSAGVPVRFYRVIAGTTKAGE